MAWPCLTSTPTHLGNRSKRRCRGQNWSEVRSPHLRLVDSTTFERPWETPEEIPPAALSVADLAREAARQGVILSMENSGQPMRSMALVVREARACLTPDEGQYLGLCPDPTNQLRRYPDSDPLAELEALPVDMIKIMHFKQARAVGLTRAWTLATWTVPAWCKYYRPRAFRGPQLWKSPLMSMSLTISPPASPFLRPWLTGDEPARGRYMVLSCSMRTLLAQYEDKNNSSAQLWSKIAPSGKTELEKPHGCT